MIEIVPPKQLTICIPKDMHRTLTLTNLTLHSVFVLLLNSHPEELSLSQNYFILQAFEERKVHLTLNWCQESMNLSTGKLRVYYQEVEEERSIEQLVEEICLSEGKSQWDELEVIVDLDLKSLNYKVDKQPGEQTYQATASAAQKNYYLMRRISNNCPQGATQRDRGSS